MTIKDLIEQLKSLPQDQQVYAWDPILEQHSPIKNFELGNAKISEEVNCEDDTSLATYIRSYLAQT